jgi:hypothetical protein
MFGLAGLEVLDIDQTKPATLNVNYILEMRVLVFGLISIEIGTAISRHRVKPGDRILETEVNPVSYV